MRLPKPRPPSVALPLARPFHTTLPLQSRHAPPPNHYETLSIAASATTSEIKTQFYALSKKHHPDLHPADPTATSRFARLSAAYAALSDPRSRALHDAALGLAAPRRAHNLHGGQSGGGGSETGGLASQPAGGRPASGLSARRRASFYSGRPPTYGSPAGPSSSTASAPHPQARSRPPKADHAQRPHYSASRAERSAGAVGSDDAHPATRDPAIPHWDRAGHFRTHEGIRARAEAARAARVLYASSAASSSPPPPSKPPPPSRGMDDEYDDTPADFVLRFLTVAGVVLVGGGGAALLIPLLTSGPPSPPPPSARRRASGVG